MRDPLADVRAHMRGERLYIAVTRPETLAKTHFESIQNLRASWYPTIIAGRSKDEIQHFVDSTIPKTWNNPNKSKNLRGRYAHSRVASAIDDDGEIVAYVYGSNNVSSKNEGLQGSMEMTAKLHLQRLVTRRYVAIREIVGPLDERLNGVMPVLGALLLDHFHEEQPVTTYTFVEEEGTKEELPSWGFINQSGATQRVQSFGLNSAWTDLERWQAESVAAVRSNLYEQPGAEKLVHGIRNGSKGISIVLD